MTIKKIFVSITFLLAILPATVYAQASIYKLPKNRRAYGIGYEAIKGAHNIWVSVERGLTDELKGNTHTGVILFEEDDSAFLFLQRFHLMYTGSLGSTDFDYYIIGAIGGTYLYRAEVEERFVIHETTISGKQYYWGDYKYVGTLSRGLQSLDLIGGGGLIAPYGKIKPFVSYAFTHLWLTDTSNVNSHVFSAGAEFDISKKISLIGRANWPFSSRGFRNPTLEISINFH